MLLSAIDKLFSLLFIVQRDLVLVPSLFHIEGISSFGPLCQASCLRFYLQRPKKIVGKYHHLLAAQIMYILAYPSPELTFFVDGTDGTMMEHNKELQKSLEMALEKNHEKHVFGIQMRKPTSLE